jgi:hypothetical protein
MIAAVLVAVAAPSGAAGMEIAMQDDLTILNVGNDRNLALTQFQAMGGTTVRMTVDHDRSSGNATDFAARLPTSRYDRAIAAVRAFGLKPQITLFWKGEKDPQKLATWMHTVAAHFGGKVNRYSVYNEPDLYLRGAQPCTKALQLQMASEFPRLIHRVGSKYRADVATRGGTVPLRRACQRYERGLQYKKVFEAAAPAIRSANVGTQVLAGETSALRGLDWFFKGSDARNLDADGWAHHPFQFTDLTPTKPANNWGIGNLALLKRTLRMPIYLTEFAYPRPNGRMDAKLYGHHITMDQYTKALTQAWFVAQRGGAKEMLQFLWFRKKNPTASDWDTSIMGFDDGSVTPAYTALQGLIKTF